MNRPTGKSRFLVAMAMVASVPAAAFEISWYQQDGPGSADGVVRLDGLDAGDLTVTTPGQSLETAIKRLGNAAVVRLSGIAGAVSESVELVVVATQGSESIRASFTLAMPAAVPPVVVDQTPQQQAALDLQASPEVPEGTRKPETALPTPAAATSVALANQQPSITTQPVETCRIIAIRPGSLKRNVGRLLNECGSRLGKWVMPGSDEWAVDWKVHDPRILTRKNAGGVSGLLELLNRHYRLEAVANRLGSVDIYRTRNRTGQPEDQTE